MPFTLGPVARESGYRLIALEIVDSTNSEAMRLWRRRDPGRVWVVAREQNQGHGRRGSAWLSPKGNLAASLLMPAPGNAPAIATLGFVAGLALDSAIRAVAPSLAAAVRLKWPNDVLVDGAKVAGILLEATSLPGGDDGVAIGIGVNISQTPRGLPFPATSLADRGAAVTAEALFEALAESWVEHESLWNAGRGFPAIRDCWLRHASGIGAPIAVRLGEEILRGTFETIDRQGRLVVREPDGSAHPISAGDVYFGGAASMGL